MIVVILTVRNLQEIFKVVESLRNVQVTDSGVTNSVDQIVCSYEEFEKLVAHKEIVHAKATFKTSFKSLNGEIYKIFSTQGFEICFDSVDDYRR